MALKPKIAIVGAGNLAQALAVSLRQAGYAIDEVISRNRLASLRRARRLAREVGARAVTASHAQLHARVVWFCVPDGQITEAARSLARAGWKGRIALHSSGALTSDELDPLRRRGAAVASAHPLMTFVRRSRPALVRVPFALEGDRTAVHTARDIVADLGGESFAIPKTKKAAYHAWGMFASPLLIALLAATERVAQAAGVSRLAARRRMWPILVQTLAHYHILGPAAAFSGPLVRGDAATVRRHLLVLRQVPGCREVYLALARLALLDLPVKNRSVLQKILK